MKTFDPYNAPKKLRISELTLPENNYFEILVPNPNNGLTSSVLKNFNQFSRAQLAEYQVNMLKKWGDIVLTLTYSDRYRAEYRPVYNSKYRKMLRASEVGIYNSINNV